MTNKIIKLQETATIADLIKWNSQWDAYQQDIKFLTNKEDVRRMRQWYSDNGQRVKSAIEKLNELTKKYYVFDGNNPKLELKDGKNISVLKEGMTEQDFMKERNEILFTEVPVIL